MMKMLSRRNDDGSRDSMSKNPFQVPSEVLGGRATPVETKTDHSHTSSGSLGTADVNEIGNGNFSVGVNPPDLTSDVEAPVSEGVEHDSSPDPQTGGSVGDSSNSDPGTGRDDDRRGEDDADPLAFLNGDSDGDELDSDSFLDSGDPDGNGAGGSGRGRRVWLWVVIGIVIALLVAGVGIGVWFMNHPQAHRLDNSSKVGGNAIGYSQGSDSNGDVDPVSDVSSFMDDEGVPKYYQQPESKVDQPTREQITKDSIESAPANAEMSLMSKASNPDLTDDPSKAQNEDGTLNPNYSYVTMDNTVPLIRDDLERLVNSLYGGWSALQDPGRIGVDSEAPAFPGSSLADMFDPSVDLSSEESLRRHVPLVADWDSDGFGGALASKDPSKPIVGVIDGYDCEFDVRGEDGDHVSCTAQVSYSWKDLYGKSHDLGGKTLGLDYKVNYNDPDGRRLLLMSVTQQ